MTSSVSSNLLFSINTFPDLWGEAFLGVRVGLTPWKSSPTGPQDNLPVFGIWVELEYP